MKTWQESGYDWEITADGSPTLRKVGGGYIFQHRMLLEYFASLYDADQQP